MTNSNGLVLRNVEMILKVVEAEKDHLLRKEHISYYPTHSKNHGKP
jgi:hypothetical protein